MTDRPFDPDRRAFMTALTAMVVVGGAGMTGIIREAVAMGSRRYPEGLIRKQGDVKINDVSAQAGAAVKPGDVVVTGSGSYAVCVVEQDAFLIRENSRIQFAGDEGAARGVAQNALKEIYVIAGKILSVFGSGARRIRTTTAIAGSRGTAVYVEAEPSHTYICACYGAVDIEAIAFPGVKETVNTKHHEEPRYIFGAGAPAPILKAPMINHTDEEIAMLESLVGRTPPFSGAGY